MVHSRCSSVIFTLSAPALASVAPATLQQLLGEGGGAKTGSAGSIRPGLGPENGVFSELEDALRELTIEEEFAFAKEKEEQRQMKMLKAARRAGREEKERKTHKKRQQEELSMAIRQQVEQDRCAPAVEIFTALRNPEINDTDVATLVTNVLKGVSEAGGLDPSFVLQVSLEELYWLLHYTSCVLFHAE